jgi:hypothetical protein
MRASRVWLIGLAVVAFLVIGAGTALAEGDSLVTIGSPSGPFPQNKQNEPAVAVDPINPSLAVAGVNEEIDNAPCSGSDCSFTPGIGDSGVYFSFDGGGSWSQPTYRGLSARSGTPVPNGPIGTVPNYFE